MPNQVHASSAVVIGKAGTGHSPSQCPVEETVCPVAAHEWVNDEYKHLVVKGSPKALAATPGQFFHLLCPSPDEGELWFRRPQSVYRVARSSGRIEFLYKVVGRGTRGLATLEPGDSLNMLGPLGVGFTLQPGWKNVIVLGRGVGLATMAPISQLAGEHGVRVTAILSARSPELALAADLFESVGTVIKVLDTDGTSGVENVEAILRRLIAQKNADAFFTCGSNPLMQLTKRLGKEHGIPGQMAMEQIMAWGLGPCYICVRTLEVNGKLEIRRDLLHRHLTGDTVFLPQALRQLQEAIGAAGEKGVGLFLHDQPAQDRLDVLDPARAVRIEHLDHGPHALEEVRRQRELRAARGKNRGDAHAVLAGELRDRRHGREPDAATEHDHVLPARLQREADAQRSEHVEAVPGLQSAQTPRAAADHLVEKFDAPAGARDAVDALRPAEPKLALVGRRA